MSYRENNDLALTKPERVALDLSGHSDTEAILPADQADGEDSIEYVRADLHDALLTRLASAEAALARAREEAFDACINLCAEVRDGKHDDAYARSGIDAGEDFIASLIRALRNEETGGE